MPVPILQVDAFTASPFHGNPAAVCLLDEPAPEEWMQAVAGEMNLSETAFVHPAPDGFGLRWFTPTTEVDLCGHATLAAAHALWESDLLDPAADARFDTRSGWLTARRLDDGWIGMDFPADPPAPVEPPPGLAAALDAEPLGVWRGRSDLLVEMASEEALRAVRPDMNRLAAMDARGVIVTAPGPGGDIDFLSRFFGPAVGVPEDPVTGSAHCTLSPFWSARLERSALTGRQISRRSGTVRTTLCGDRVMLAGEAVTVLRGTLVTPDPNRRTS
jgi:predicted PhzF superfamily epimerase YddE/YHI9